ncbi:MAG: protein kinase [Pseudomonadota bacterium]
MKKIGKFKVYGLLGKGGMGKVFKIEYPVTQKVCALKLLDPEPVLTSLLGLEAIEEIFTAEAVTMARIRHPHVAEILDFDRFQGKPYYIMDFYCNNLGTTLGESYETEKPSRILSVDKAIHYTRQILEGLSCLHYWSIIHRDIKPFNILLTDQDTVKICDFGLSKLRGETFKGHQSLKIGSPYYASPEQETDPENVDCSADLFSTGVMLYRMLTGRLPITRKERPSSLNPDLDDDWDGFILKAMADQPGDRYGEADDMISDLDQLTRLWQEKKEKICMAPLSLLQNLPAKPPQGKLRSEPAKIPKRSAENQFLLDELMRPSIYTANDFKLLSRETVLDRATGLIWQWSGTKFPVNWKGAGDYIRTLNQVQPEGISPWRLPTIPELMTLICQTPSGQDHCIEAAFDPAQKWLWSADRCTWITAWYVSLDMGFVAANDFSGFYHVKAVCSAPEPWHGEKSC